MVLEERCCSSDIDGADKKKKLNVEEGDEGRSSPVRRDGRRKSKGNGGRVEMLRLLFLSVCESGVLGQ
ncbi:hypothetical protein R1flu_001957 [Riccia fluitans]|uniref:Uncharacterized protein n=1 Tax=Riccia fluitans TaxID=41844 RepID=A0ABD1Y834_9MARC